MSDKDHKDEQKKDDHGKKDDHKKDDHGHGDTKKKRTFSGWLIFIALSVLALVIFFFVINPLLGMLFPAMGQTVGTTATGMQDLSVKLLELRMSISAFLTAIFGIVLAILIAVLLLILAVAAVKAIRESFKSGSSAPH